MKTIRTGACIVTLCLVVASCSKQSEIEGMIMTSPTTVTLNTEVAKGASKTVNVAISNTNTAIVFQYNYTKYTSTEVRNCMVYGYTGGGTTAVYFNLSSANGSYIKPENEGVQVNSTLIPVNNAVGSFFYTTNNIGQTNYTYTSTNGVQYDKTYYIPLKLLTSLGSTSGIILYGYMQVTMGAEKVVINKIVYNSYGDIRIGD